MAATTKKPSSINLKKVVAKLLDSTRGQIFLVNLYRGLALLEHKQVFMALDGINVKMLRGQPELSFLTYVRDILQDPLRGLHMSNQRNSFDQFAPDKMVVNILSLNVFNAHLADTAKSISGHAAGLPLKPGSEILSFRHDAKTRDYFWMAPLSELNPHSIVKEKAERARDILGLVHIRDKQALVALHIKFLTLPNFYRPTIVEANPNARFRQIDPTAISEDRWGRTVDLAAISADPPRGNFGGVKEMISAGVAFSALSAVSAFYLGLTSTDQSTTTTDAIFLEHLLEGEVINLIADEFVKRVSAL